MDTVKEFVLIAEDPGAYARRVRESGRRVIGFYCSYTPEEIIQAAGMHPMRLFGTSSDSSIADRHLQSYCCSLVRGALAESIQGGLDYLDGTVFPHTCDSIQRLSDIWRLNTSHGFFADVVLPVKLNTESARQYMRDVLVRFRNDLESYFNIRITNEDLARAVRTYNVIRTRLGEIYEINSRCHGLLSGGELNSIVRASMFMEREVLVERLQELVAELVAAEGEGKSVREPGRRLMLVGNVCDQPEIYTIIESSGARVVWDDMCTGTRYFEGTIREDGDPLEAIADRYFERQVCPSKHLSPTARAEHIVSKAREHRVEGVIFLYLKFCDPHSFDYPYLRDSLEQVGVPSMLLEIEGQIQPEGQLLTRIETFSQMLDGGAATGGRESARER